ncbi:MAG: c-type cytochrome [Pseudolabrys sp.]|jgi:mono/diheme cytochrome c family protein
MRPPLLLTAALLAAWAAPAAAFTQRAATGTEEFGMSCAVCHGVDGRGDGPMAHMLKVKPADLTTLARRNGGTFPFEKVVEIIDGRRQVKGHGTREMPVWGSYYEMDIARRYGPHGSESLVKARVETLARYVEAMQEK